MQSNLFFGFFDSFSTLASYKDDLGDCDIILLLSGVYVKSEEHLCGMLFDPYGLVMVEKQLVLQAKWYM